MRSTVVACLAAVLFLALTFSASAADKPTAFTIHTQVASIDLGQSTFTTDGKNHGSLTFSLAQKATVVDNGQIVGFGALKVGDVVEIRYSKVNDVGLEASNIEIQGTARPPHGHHQH